MNAQLAAMARVLDASERKPRIRGDHPVHEDHTGLDFVNEAFLLPHVLGPNAGTQTETAVIGDLDGMIDIPRPKQGSYRTKEFFAVCRRLRRDVREHRGRVEIARTVQALAARQNLGAGCDRLADISEKGSPTFNDSIFCTNLRSKSSAIGSARMNRLAAIQDWPLF